ncbi:TPA: retron St85 family effector protein [Yersinia enterocolitica]|uniref:retron St85 family effector protein n=1 Tax=Yersinia TaxID=629 RepID=UPI001FE3FBDA|nr:MULTISPECIES: retron St85 family effector protein [Yersinia]
MSDSAYLTALLEQFGEMNTDNFIVQYTPPLVFICGGPTVKIGASLRERIFRYAAGEKPELFNALVLAENSKDYFKNGAYSDLMQFEEDIANISTLIVICLESAGSLVELGLFANRKMLAQRLLVFVPAEELEGDEENDIPPKSSFIYLGPIENLRRIDKNSVSIYPWPKDDSVRYDDIDLVVHDIEERLRNIKKTEGFDKDNTGHLAILIYEIIYLSEPIKKIEIDWALCCIGIELSSAKITRLIYLLEMMKLISSEGYSGTDYFYLKNPQISKMKFGRSSKGKVQDAPNIRVAIRQSYLLNVDVDETAKKRKNVLVRINALRERNRK